MLLTYIMYPTRIETSIKRLFDILASSLMIILLIPVWIILTIAICITSPGGAFFFQERTGYKGRTFLLIKFRTMYPNKEADTLQATRNDSRVTPIGNFLRRSSLDELPQLFNVLKGDMSLVGPRPHMLKHTEMYSSKIPNYMDRHIVRPGLTGYAQIQGYRGETPELILMEKRVAADLKYIEEFSLLLDIKILWKTLLKVLLCKL